MHNHYILHYHEMLVVLMVVNLLVHKLEGQELLIQPIISNHIIMSFLVVLL